MNIISGGRGAEIGAPFPVEAYDVETGTWEQLSDLPRFRHAAWIHDNTLYVYGGFEHTKPSLAISKQIGLRLTEFIEKHRSKKEAGSYENKFGEKQIAGSEKIYKPIPCQSYKNGEDSFRLSPRVLVAMNSGPEVPVNIKKAVKNIPLKNLREEGKKLLSSNKILFGPTEAEMAESETPNKSIAQAFITHLLKPKDWNKDPFERKFMFSKKDIIKLADECTDIVKAQPTVIRVKAPIKVFGDFHGQYQDMMRFFELWRCPIESANGGDIESYDYLFLGDYIDRGANSLETICLLMALKVKFPEQIHLLRGNHEDFSINQAFGFAEECEERLDDELEDEYSIFQTLNRFFEWLPLAGIIEDKILCLHGGIGSTLRTIADLEKLERPIEIVHEVKTSIDQLLIDVLWSDPTDNDQELGIQKDAARDPYDTGFIVKYGPDRVADFLRKNNLMMIIRGHECVMDGIERFAQGQLITVFSATDYCGKHKNAGGALFIQKDCEIVPKLIYPVDINSEMSWLENKKQTPPNWKAGSKDKSYA